MAADTDSDYDRIPMQYLIIDASQDPTYKQKESYGAATVGCWIRYQTRKNAYLIAKGWIEERGWVVLSLEDQYPVNADDYKNNSEHRRYFEQALTDDEVFVFFTCPP